MRGSLCTLALCVDKNEGEEGLGVQNQSWQLFARCCAALLIWCCPCVKG